MRIALALLTLACAAAAQQRTSLPRPPSEKPGEQAPPEESPPRPSVEKEQQQPAPPPNEDELAKLKWDMTEVAPVVTHHQLGKLHYTATAGRLPIKDQAGGIEAEMFFVAYTLDGAQPASRPLTFAFNGGPGSASIWLHMGALGPRRVKMEPEGWMPASPYRRVENTASPLDKTDLVLVDAIGTGFSRPANMQKAKKFWGLKGDAAAFGEFIRLYLSRSQRWSSPLYLLGESYGTTRAAEVSGYLTDRGIAFKGIMLLSMVLDFETLETARTNDLAYALTLPTMAMIAQQQHKLAADLPQDPAKLRQEATRFAMSDYLGMLARGDALSPQERADAVAKIARYTGLKPEIVDWANLRPDVGIFTHYLLADEHLQVGRLDGRFTGPHPKEFFERDFYDPAMAAVSPPTTAVFNDYVRTELGYANDLPYYTSAGQLSTQESFQFWRKWEWGNAAEGFPETSSSLRAAMQKNPHLRVLVMEGLYDLATPFAAAEYTMSHLDVGAAQRKNLSYITYESGHMVYLRESVLQKFHDDVAAFVEQK
ncbi:MAG TPA: hypothetical protein VLW85_18135 [Myxococcales bacterium]|nr:hypothetical protein [Myxococcales bacterium]